MRKLPSFTKFAFMRNPHVYMHYYCNGDILLNTWLNIVDQNGQWHGRNVLLHFKFVRMRIAITDIVPRGYLGGPP